MTRKVYVSAANTARLIRKSLKQEFPGQKFYVRTSTYSGGASIRIDWMDGPTTDEVDAIVKVYEGSDFDGMIDLKTYVSHWMMPDGSVQIAKSAGSTGSGGFISPTDNAKPHPDAKLVHFMADYIHANRAHSKELLEQVARRVSEETGWDAPKIVEWAWWVGGKERGKQYSFDSRYTDADGECQYRYFNEALQTTSVPNSKIN